MPIYIDFILFLEYRQFYDLWLQMIAGPFKGVLQMSKPKILCKLESNLSNSVAKSLADYGVPHNLHFFMYAVLS